MLTIRSTKPFSKLFETFLAASDFVIILLSALPFQLTTTPFLIVYVNYTHHTLFSSLLSPFFSKLLVFDFKMFYVAFLYNLYYYNI